MSELHINDIEVITLDDVQIDNTDITNLAAKVIVFNDESHSFQQVINQLIKAIGCSYEVALEKTMMIHTSGQATVFTGKMIDCIRVSGIIQEIDLKTQIIY